LLTGGDLLAARARINGDFVVIPKTMLKSDEEIFLDGMSLAELQQKLGMPVHHVDLDSFAAVLFITGL
jgi:NifB/MoaA-like Fe-S oxidoreductase